MKLRLGLLALLVAALAATAAVAAQPAEAKKGGSYAHPGDGFIGAQHVNGTFTITSFKVVDGVLTAVGTFSNETINTPASAPVTAINGTPIGGASAAAVTAQQATCEILDLTLGPLDLDLLGLVVHLDQVHLTITAEQGQGNLLGNLLCAVAGLLDPPTGGGGAGGLQGLLQTIANLLNQILGQL